MGTILKVKNLEKSFDNEEQKVTILKDIDFEVAAGDFVTVMGPSGSGKSTLLYSISGMDSIDSGQVLLAGEEISNLPEDQASQIRLNKMGFIFQNPSLLKNLNLIDNIMLPAYKFRSSGKDAIQARAKQLMQETGIEALAYRSVQQVSGGELQRASICRALINQPMIIFGDEPTGALNSKTSEEIIQLLKEINEKGATIILVTHDPKVAMASRRVVFMKDGQICSQLNIEQLSENERQEAILAEMVKFGI